MFQQRSYPRDIKLRFRLINALIKHLHLNHPKKIIIGHLNKNSIRNKFNLLQKMVTTDRYFDNYRDKTI